MMSASAPFRKRTGTAATAHRSPGRPARRQLEPDTQLTAKELIYAANALRAKSRRAEGQELQAVQRVVTCDSSCRL